MFCRLNLEQLNKLAIKLGFTAESLSGKKRIHIKNDLCVYYTTIITNDEDDDDTKVQKLKDVANQINMMQQDKR